MQRRAWTALVSSVLTASLLWVGPSLANSGGQEDRAGGPPDKAQFDVEYLSLNSNVDAAIYTPAGSGSVETAVVVSHPESDYRDHDTCEGMARRGYVAVCAKSRGSRLPDDNALDVAPLVDYARDELGMKNVVLIGSSLGAPMMTYYQDVAENGLAACNGPEKIVPCSDDLADLTPADAVILRDGHLGAAVSAMLKLDPSVVVEDQFGRVGPEAYDSSLDPFLEANGFNETGDPTYSEEFLTNYFAGQAARMNRQMDLLNERIGLLDAGNGTFPDNESFVSAWTGGRIWEWDRRLVSHTKDEHKLITPDGIVTQVVESIRPMGGSRGEPVPGAERRAESIQFSSATVTNVRDQLNGETVRVDPDFMVTEDDITGIDWFSQNGTTPASLAGIHVPVLNIAATGHYWVVPNEISHNMTASEDKELIYVEGATHGFDPCDECEGATPGKYDNVGEDSLNYMANWIRDRFGK